MWAALRPVGRAPGGGYRRFSWTAADRECREWFAAEAGARGLTVEGDGNGNLFAWWDTGREAGVRRDAVLTGSHLDSVPDGGAYDGPLGVVSALAAIDALRARGVVPRTAGRRGRVRRGGRRAVRRRVPRVAAAHRRDRPRTCTRAARRRRRHVGRGDGRGGTRPGRDRPRPRRSSPDRRRFVELHVEQGRALGPRRAVGVASAIWPHGRWRFDFTGQGNHAGTTLLGDRRDPMLPFAHTVLAAREAATRHGAVATMGKVARRPERRQRHPVVGARVAGRPRAGRGDRPRDRGAGPVGGGGGGATARRRGRADRGVLHARRGLRRRPARPAGGGPRRTPRCCRPAPVTTRGSCRRTSRPRCCSSATRPGSRTRRRSTPRRRTAWPGSTRSPTCWKSWHAGDAPDVPRRVRLARRRARSSPVCSSRPAVSGSPGVTAGAPPGAGRDRLPGSRCRAWPTPTPTRSTGRCAAARRPNGGTFWTWRERMYALAHGWTRTATTRWPGRSTPRWRWPGSPAWASSTTSTTTRTDAVRRPERHGRGAASPPRPTRASGSPCSTPATWPVASARTPPDARSAASATARPTPGPTARRRCAAAGHARVGAAIHSVRAVPREQIGTVAAWADEHGRPCTSTCPNSRPRTTRARGRTALTPAALLAEGAALGPAHGRGARDPPDRRGRGAARRDPYGRLRLPDHRTRPRRRHRPAPRPGDAGAPLSLGSDQHAVVDLFEEARAVELDERLRTRRRGHWTAAELLTAATSTGHEALGWPEAGPPRTGRVRGPGHRLPGLRTPGGHRPGSADRGAGLRRVARGRAARRRLRPRGRPRRPSRTGRRRPGRAGRDDRRGHRLGAPGAETGGATGRVAGSCAFFRAE